MRKTGSFRQSEANYPLSVTAIYSAFVRSSERMSSSGPKPGSSGVLSARRDAMVLAVLITAVLLLIWNGSTFFQPFAGSKAAISAADVRVASTALTLNVALILFGWRRYVDLQHEAEMRAEQEQPRGVARDDRSRDRPLQPQGLRRPSGASLCAEAGERGDNLVVISFQIHRFKSVNDQHGYETGDWLLKSHRGRAPRRARQERGHRPPERRRIRSRASARRVRDEPRRGARRYRAAHRHAAAAPQ